MSWAILFILGALGNALGARTFSADPHIFFQALLAAAAGFCFVAGLVAVVKSARWERELWEAIELRSVRAEEHA
jgi:hypothetical protein